MSAPNPSPEERNRAYVILTVSTFLLALNHIIGRAVHEYVPPLGLTFWRWFLPSFVLLFLVRKDIRMTLPIYRAHWREFVLLGGLVVGASGLLMVALNYTTATNVVLINATQPTLTVLFSWLFYGVRLKFVQVLGILAAFIGALTMVCRGNWRVLTTLDFNPGDPIVLVAMLGLAGYSVRYVRMPPGLGNAQAYFPIVLAGSLVLLPFYIAESLLLRPVPLNAISVGAILAVAVLVTILAMPMWNVGMKLIGANRASMFINLVPVFGAVLAVTLLGEQFELYHLAGMILISIGVWLVVGTTRRPG